jgi:hypothetical protein
MTSPPVEKIIGVNDVGPEVRRITEDIRNMTVGSLSNKDSGTKGNEKINSIIAEMFAPSFKVEPEFSVPLTETHEMLSDGKTWIPKYEYYMPGMDNEARNAARQTTSQQLFNPIKRFATKVSRGIPGDILSFAYGIGEAVTTGRAESIFDNDFSNYISDLDKKSDFNYKNYYTDEQLKQGIGFNTHTYDQVLGGVEFTARALGAEAIVAAVTGGSSIPSSLARLGMRLGIEEGVGLARAASKVARGVDEIAEVGADISKANKILKAPVTAIAEKGGAVYSSDVYTRGLDKAFKFGKWGDFGNQARYAVTSSAYESGFEAKKYQEDAERTFWDYYRNKGTEPTEKELGDFYSKLDDTTWGVFGANMAILSASNLAMFGDMMNIKNPFPKLAEGSFLNKKLFKIGTEVGEDGLWKPMSAGFFNKAAAFSKPLAEGMFAEGVFEEGMQGVASNMAKNYIASTYDPKAMKETSDYVSAFSKAFKDQYSSKEGLEEVGIGAIIGGLFGGVHGISETANDYKKQKFVATVQNAMPQVADNIVNNLYTNENLSSLFAHSNRLQNITKKQEEAESKGDIIGSALHASESFVSMMQAASSVGKGDEFMDILKASIKGMDNAQIAESQGIDIKDVEAFKAEKIKGLTELSEDYAKAREVGRYLFGNGKIGGFTSINGEKVNNQNLIDSFAYISTMGGISQRLAGDSFNAFQDKLASVGTNPDIVSQFGSIAALHAAGQVEVNKFKQAQDYINKLKSEQRNLEDEILALQEEEQTKPENTKRLQEIAERMTSLNSELSDAVNKKDLYWNSISDNFQQKLGRTGILPQIDFDNFNNRIGDLKNLLRDNESISQFDKIELDKLLQQYDNANSTFKSFAQLGQAMADPKFTYKVYNGLFSGLRAKNKSLNELTRDTLVNLYSQDIDVSEILMANQPIASPITDDVYNSVSNDSNYEVSDDVIDFIADKIKRKKDLSDRERKVYNNYKSKVDDVIIAKDKQKETDDNDPINSESDDIDVTALKAKLVDIRNEIRELKNGIISIGIQYKYDVLQRVIEREMDPERIAQLKGYQELLFSDRIAELESQIEEIEEPLNKQNLENKKQTLKDEIGKLKDKIIREVIARTKGFNNNDDIDKMSIYELEKKIKSYDETHNEELKEEYEKLKELLNKRIAELSKEPYYTEVERLRKLEKELKDLDSIQKEPFDPKAEYGAQLQWVVDNIDILDFNNADDLANAKKPNVESIRRYKALVNKQTKTKEDRDEIEKLRKELLPFTIILNSEFDGIPLIDIIEAYNQYKNYQDINENQANNRNSEEAINDSDSNDDLNTDNPTSKSQNSEEDDTNKNANRERQDYDETDNIEVEALPRMIGKVQYEQQSEPEFRSAIVGLTYDGAYITGNDKNKKIFHIKLGTILKSALYKGLNITLQEIGTDKKGKLKLGGHIEVTESNLEELAIKYDNFGGVKINIGNDIVLHKSKNEVSFGVIGDIEGLLGLKAFAITGQPTSYNLLYEQKIDGTLGAKESEFEVKRKGNVIPFNRQVLNSLGKGDIVQLFFDVNDDYNKTLSEEEYVTKGNIYVMKNGSLVNILKANCKYETDSEDWNNLREVRRRVVENSLKNGKGTQIKLKGSFMGLPIINLNSDGRIVTYDNLDSNDNVIGYGYVDKDGNHVYHDNLKLSSVNTQYTNPYGERGVIIPIVVFKYEGKNYTFPIVLKSKHIDVTNELDALLNDDSLSDSKKRMSVNLLLEKYGIQSKELAWTNQNNTLSKIREKLSDVIDVIDIADSKSFKEAEKSSFINLDEPFMNSKLIFDFDTAKELLRTVKKRKIIKTKPINKKGKNNSDENIC